MSDAQNFISFPPGYLGRSPQKFPLLANDERLFAISKPAGISSSQHEWSLGKPDFSMALRRELLNEKPQLARLGIEGLFRVFNLDVELSGILLFAKTEEWEGILKNAAGSSQLTYTFHLLAKSSTEDRFLSCDLPIAKHFTEKRMLVSHKTGKKCETRFKYLRSFGAYQMWEAQTTELRPHQIRLHAAEVGLEIVGESLYAQGDWVYLSNLKRGYLPSGKREKPIYSDICIHLVQVEFGIPEHSLDAITAPLPSRFETLLKRLDEYRGGRR